MAIVPMKRLLVVAPETAREGLVQTLQDLGALHLVPLEQELEVPGDLATRLATVRRLRKTLASRRRALGEGVEPAEGSGPEILAAVEDALARRAELEQRIQNLTKEEALALPWKQVVQADIAELDRAGLHVAVYRVPEQHRDRLEDLPAGVLKLEFDLPDAKSGEKGVLLASFGEFPDVKLERLTPPSRPLAEVRKDLEQTRAELVKVDSELDALSLRDDALASVEADLQDRLERAEALAGARQEGEVFALAGWCPAPKVPKVKEAILQAGGAVFVQDPGPEDEPPIELENGPLVRAFEPLLKAFQLPNYREGDPTVFIAPFMGVFFGFCLGDAGYGLLLFLLATWAGKKFDVTEGEALKALRLIQILAITTMVVGVLIGNVFGVPFYRVEGKFNLGMDPDSLLFVLSRKPDVFFYASLGFGVVQLTLGILIKLLRHLARGMYQHALGSLGWLAMMPAIAVWVIYGITWPFFVAMAAIFLFNSPDPKLIKRVGGGAWALYNLTGLFGDVMSYARIFGLGLSSGIIAQVVNIIAMTVKDAAPVVGWIGALLILVGGHVFNFAMAVIGSVVHPARLQFLEFFGKFFEGGGQAYSPFQRSKGG